MVCHSAPLLISLGYIQITVTLVFSAIDTYSSNSLSSVLECISQKNDVNAPWLGTLRNDMYFRAHVSITPGWITCKSPVPLGLRLHSVAFDSTSRSEANESTVRSTTSLAILQHLTVAGLNMS